METLTGVASLNVASVHLVWRTGEDSVHPRVHRPGFLTLAAHASDPQFAYDESGQRTEKVHRSRFQISHVLQRIAENNLAALCFVKWRHFRRTLADAFCFSMRMKIEQG